MAYNKKKRKEKSMFRLTPTMFSNYLQDAQDSAWYYMGGTGMTNAEFRAKLESADPDEIAEYFVKEMGNRKVFDWIVNTDDESAQLDLWEGLKDISKAVTMSFRDIIQMSGDNIKTFAKRYFTPYDTIIKWTSGMSAPPLYAKMLFLKDLGYFDYMTMVEDKDANIGKIIIPCEECIRDLELCSYSWKFMENGEYHRPRTMAEFTGTKTGKISRIGSAEAFEVDFAEESSFPAVNGSGKLTRMPFSDRKGRDMLDKITAMRKTGEASYSVELGSCGTKIEFVRGC